MSDSKAYDIPAIYQIRLKGELDHSWSDWFDGFTIISAEGNTELTGQVADQAALHGILTQLNNLSLPIVSVIRVKGGQDE